MWSSGGDIKILSSAWRGQYWRVEMRGRRGCGKIEGKKRETSKESRILHEPLRSGGITLFKKTPTLAAKELK